MNTTALRNRLSSIEKSIERNRELLAKGGDKNYYTSQILHLNSLAAKIEEQLNYK